MSRYRLQVQNEEGVWIDTEVLYNTKEELSLHIGFYKVDYEWRVGYCFKPYNSLPKQFVWNSGKKIGELVKT